MRSRFAPALMVVGVIAALAASSSSARTSSAQIGTATPGTIVLGADFTAVPNQMIVGGKKEGFDYDLCTGIAKELGVKINWVNNGFDSLIPGLEANRFDALCTAVDITAPREQIMNMIQYTKWGQTMFTLKKNASSFRTCHGGTNACYSEFAGKTVAVPSGGNEVLALEAANKKMKDPMKLMQFGLNQEVFTAVANGTAVAGFLDDPEFKYYNSNNGSPFAAILIGADSTPVGLTTLKANTQLANALVKGLKKMKADGTYARILKKWNLGAVPAFTINPKPTA